MARTFPIPKRAHALKDLRAVTFSSNGDALLALAEKKLLRSERGRTQPDWFTVFKEAAHLATSSSEIAIAGGKKVGLVDADSAEVRLLRRPAGGKSVLSLRWSPDGEWLGAFGDGQVDIFDAVGAHVCRVADASLGRGKGTVGPRATVFAFAGGNLVSFDARSGKRAPTKRVRILDDAKELLGIASTADAVVVHYEAPRRGLRGTEYRLCFLKPDGTKWSDFPTKESKYARICTSPDGQRIAAGAYALTIHIFDSKGKKRQLVRRQSSNPPVALALGPGVLADAQLSIDVLPARSLTIGTFAARSLRSRREFGVPLRQRSVRLTQDQVQQWRAGLTPDNAIAPKFRAQRAPRAELRRRSVVPPPCRTRGECRSR